MSKSNYMAGPVLSTGDTGVSKYRYISYPPGACTLMMKGLWKDLMTGGLTQVEGQRRFLEECGLVAQSCPPLCDPMNCSLPDSSVHGILQARILVERGGCHSLLQGIFPTQGLNPGLLHCKQILYRLSHQGSPLAEMGLYFFYVYKDYLNHQSSSIY